MGGWGKGSWLAGPEFLLPSPCSGLSFRVAASDRQPRIGALCPRTSAGRGPQHRAMPCAAGYAGTKRARINGCLAGNPSVTAVYPSPSVRADPAGSVRFGANRGGRAQHRDGQTGPSHRRGLTGISECRRRWVGVGAHLRITWRPRRTLYCGLDGRLQAAGWALLSAGDVDVGPRGRGGLGGRAHANSSCVAGGCARTMRTEINDVSKRIHVPVSLRQGAMPEKR